MVTNDVYVLGNTVSYGTSVQYGCVATNCVKEYSTNLCAKPFVHCQTLWMAKIKSDLKSTCFSLFHTEALHDFV